MRFDNIHQDGGGDYDKVLVPCPCVNDVTGLAEPGCIYCYGLGKLLYSVCDLEFEG
jgi:hypothetical protein